MLNSTEKNIACLLLMVTIFAGFLVPGLSEVMAPIRAGKPVLDDHSVVDTYGAARFWSGVFN